MLDMSRTSVEYVCKHVMSPNIARRFGHKLGEDVNMSNTAQATKTSDIAHQYSYPRPRPALCYSYGQSGGRSYQARYRSSSMDTDLSYQVGYLSSQGWIS